MSLGYFTCVLRTYFTDVSDANDVMPENRISRDE